MERLLIRQKELLKEIERLNVNFGKDGPGRKTQDYIQKKLETLESLWQEFYRNNEVLQQCEDKSGEYFEKDVFKTMKNFYEATKTVFLSYKIPQEEKLPIQESSRPTFELPSTSKNVSFSTKCDRGTSSKVEELLKKQASNFRSFSRAISNIDLDIISDQWEFEDHLRTLQTRWSAIDSLHLEIDMELEGSNESYDQAYSHHERSYFQIKKAINSRMCSVSHKEKFVPRMEIPEFSGNYQHWISFKDLFSESIHRNASLSKAQKMQFLKSKVRGEAERLIQHLSISTENYDTCWEILNNRFNNKKLIFNTHVHTMMSIPTIQQPAAYLIKRLHDTTQECLNAVKNLGADISTWDPLLVYLLSQKLDSQTYSDYMESLNQPRELPNLKEFLEFLESKFTIMETSRRKPDGTQLQQKNNSTPQFSTSGKFHQKPNNFKNSFLSNQVHSRPIQNNFKKTCPLCEKDHGIYFCKIFLEMSPIVKLKTIAKLNYCNNCLYDHNGNACTAKKRCRECNGPHNSILHEAFKSKTNNSEIIKKSMPQPSIERAQTSNAHVSQQKDCSEVLLATAMIKVQGVDGTYHIMRALIDQGSQLSLISENAAQILSLPRESFKGVICGVGVKESNCKGRFVINFQSMDEQNDFSVNVLIINNLVRNLPNATFTKPSWSYLDNIKLADPHFYVSRPIDILLGANIYPQLMLEGVCKSQDSSLPIAQQTQLGWILCGSVTTTLQCNVVLNNIEQIEKFWNIEDITENDQLSSEDLRCIEYYKQSTTRKADGRYQVRLPLQENFQEELGLSKPRAVAQFLQLERKFKKQPDMAIEYKHFFDEYIQLRHMKQSQPAGNKTPQCYLPHHCVVREGSLTTSHRAVFNASSLTTSGKSLNDLMACGPNLQQDLQSLILKWRQFKYVFTADIEKMFRQIWMHPDDQQLQKIIWRASPQQPLQEFQLTTVTYGTKAAPFLAMMTLRQLARDERENFQDSQAPQTVEECFFMDDLIQGQHSLDKALKLQEDLIKLLSSGGFNLRKWSANEPLLLENVKTSKEKQDKYEFQQIESTKTLGLRWDPLTDSFSFEAKLSNNTTKVTKRTLLSDISKLFDPLGWLTPVTTNLKILFQQVWNTEIGWDDKVPESILQDWNIIKSDVIININKVHVTRWLYTEQAADIELHAFCDASLKAYACVIYCKNNSNNNIVLIGGKARIVSTKKNISLPRLELCGAELMTKLISKVYQCLSSNEYNITTLCWTDSTAVLGWIQGDPKRWKPFVANRVKKITEVVSPNNWRYVKSADNPADCASRGLLVSQLLDHNLWWQGPSWLSTFEKNKESQQLFSTNEELKSSVDSAVVSNAAVVTQCDDVIELLLNRYSSLTKIIKTLAWWRRLLKKDHKMKTSYLSIQEVQEARDYIIKHTQRKYFSEEISCLQASKNINKNSKILNLHPFLDKDGLLRVGGRLKNAYIDPDMKNPIIISHTSRLSQLLIDDMHLRTFHGGARLTLANLRNKFWVTSGNRVVKSRLQPCVICKKNKPSLQDQLMGDLPAARANPARPFFHTGVDFTGHVEVKANKGRGIKTTKGYVAVFVCMVTKAVHLELVSDLSSSAFIAALRRLSARRGTPHHIYSDNGTNFVGASRILKQEYSELQKVMDADFHKQVVDLGIEWHFQAPSWPSAGGLWEAAVKSLKYHLRRVLTNQKLTFEEFSTLLSQLEACLNSRPLCALSEDPDELDFLTPSHFLSSGPILTIVDTEHDDRTRWRLIQKIHKDIWQKWRDEYLLQLTTRSKWNSPKENIKLNDIVTIHDPNLPAGKWAMGRVIQLHPGSDGYVRVVTLKTKHGVIKRPVVKLSVLPVHNAVNQTPIVTSSEQDQEIKSQTNNQRQKRDRKQCNRSHKTSTLTSIIYSIVYFMTLLSTCFSYKITALNNTQGLYFDKIANIQLIRDEWKVFVYYNMDPYWEGFAAYQTFYEHLENTCFKINNQSNCDVIMSQLRHSYAELEYYNSVLLNRPKLHMRRRRGLINGVGYLAHSLFGVLDEEFAEQYAKDIDLIHMNEKHLATLMKNQTSIVEAEYNLLKRTEESIQNQHKKFNRHILVLEQNFNKMKVEITSLDYKNEFTSSAMAAQNLLQNLKNIQDTIIDTITNIYNGKFNVHLITPRQLQHELNSIAGHLENDISLPVTTIQTSTDIYHLLKVKARVTEQYLIIEIKVPLISRDKYELHKIIGVPKQEGRNMVTLIPISEYIGVNLQKDSYFPLSSEEIEKCIYHDLSTYFCHLRTPVFKMRSDQDLCISDFNNNCKIQIDLCKNQWISLKNINTYFYFCCDQCQLRAMCGDQVTASQLTAANVIDISENCVIKTENFTVFSHRDLSSILRLNMEVEKPEIHQINNILNFTINPLNHSTSNDLRSDIILGEIKQNIEKLKSADILTDKISYHDIHHYSIIYCLVGIILVTGVIFIWRRFIRGRREGTPAPASDATAASASQPQPSGQRDVDNTPPDQESVTLEMGVRTKDRGTTPVLRKVTFSDSLM